MAKQNKKARLLLILAFVLILGFIWGQSFFDEISSSRESGYITIHFIRPVVRFFAGNAAANRVKDTTTRKIAHVIEYAVLGLVFGSVLKNCRPRFWFALLFCMAVGLLDETIQLYTGRGSNLTDVWIDAGGAALGLSILLFAARKKRKKEQKETGTEPAG